MAPQRGRALAAGLPLIVLTVGGWLGLSVFLKDRFAVQDAHSKGVDLHAPVERQRAKRFSVDEELQRLQEAVAEDYENKPVPRPKEWEDG